MARNAPTDVQALFTKDLRPYVLPSFWCRQIGESLLQEAKDSNDYTYIVQFYGQQVDAAKASILYPRQRPVADPPLHECYVAGGPHVMIQCWTRLISDIAHVAAHVVLSLRASGQERDDLSRTNRRRLACQLVLAMRLMLLARLYYERTDSNITALRLTAEAISGEVSVFPRSRLMLKKLTSAVKQYDRQLRKWRVRPALPIGWKDGSDAFAYDQWAQSFAQVVPGEEGWSRFPRLLSRELHFLHATATLRQRVAELPLSFLSVKTGGLFKRIVYFPVRALRGVFQFLGLTAVVLLLWLFMLTCGFGLKPRRVAGSVTGAILFFAGICLADDTVIGACSRMSGQQVAQSLYSAITNLTTLGGGPAQCGPYSGVIISIETLVGYFLLSILAAMFFVWLTGR
jgi:hypothetical protein